MAATQVTVKSLLDLKADKEERRDALAAKVVNKEAITETELAEYRQIKDVEIPQLNINLEMVRDAEAAKLRSIAPHTGTPGNRDYSEKDAKDLSKFSLLRMLSLGAQALPLDGVEAEVHNLAKAEARTNGVTLEGFGVPSYSLRGQTATGQTTNAGDQGGVAVPTEINELIKSLWDKNFLNELGATRLNGLMGNQSFPVQTSKPAASSLTEIESLSATEVLFSNITMSPDRRGVYIPISKQALLQMSFDIQSFITEQIRSGMDYKLNLDAQAALSAAVVSGNSNLLAAGATGLAPTYAHIVSMESQLASLNADQGSLAYLVNSKTRGKLKLVEKFSGTNGNPVWEGGATPLNGYKAVTSNIIKSNLTKSTGSGLSEAYFGNFADFYVGFWGGMDFVVDPYSLAQTGQVKLIANMFWNTKVARNDSFTGFKDFITT